MRPGITFVSGPGPVSKSVKLSKHVPRGLRSESARSQPLSQEGSTTRYRFEKIRVNEPNPGLQHQLGSVVGLGKIDTILSLTGKPDLGQVSCKAELYKRAERHIPLQESVGV